MKMYRTSTWDLRIDEIEADKANEKSVWIGGNRNSRHSSYHNYFETWEDAKDFLTKHCENSLESAKRKCDYCRSRLETAKALKKEKHG